MAKRTTQSTYQYEPLVTPAKWQGDERRFSIRLSQLLDDLFGKYGSMASKVKSLEKAVAELPTEPEEPEEPEVPSITIDNVYPVGSVYVSSENVNPASVFGGTWELVDKLLKHASYNQNTNVFLIDANNVSTLGASLLTVDGNTMEFYVNVGTSVALGDTPVNLFTIALKSIGISAFDAVKRIIGYSDGGNGLVNASVSDSGLVAANDVVTKTSGGTIASGSTMQFNAVWKIPVESRMDAFCDRFFWKRTA